MVKLKRKAPNPFTKPYKPKSKLLEAAKEAVQVAKGTIPAARLTIKGHAYVPEIKVDRDSLWTDPILTAPATIAAQQLAKTLGIAGDVVITKEIYRTIMAVAVDAVLAKTKRA